MLEFLSMVFRDQFTVTWIVILLSVWIIVSYGAAYFTACRGLFTLAGILTRIYTVYLFAVIGIYLLS